MSIQAPFEGYAVRGRYSRGKILVPATAPVAAADTQPSIADMTTGSAEFTALFRPRPFSIDKWSLDGFWTDATIKFKPGFPLHMAYLPSAKKLEGNITYGMFDDRWTSYQDSYIALGYNTDSTSSWCLGKPVFTAAVPDNSLLSLIRRFHTPEVVEYNCEACGLKSTAMKRMEVETHPYHLLTVAKRFEMDWQTGNAFKLMAAVPFPAYFVYPGQPSIAYGLYAVLVHSGATLTRGHYYLFGRPSSCDHLHFDDCSAHPWCKFDDRDVTPSSFRELSQFLARSEAASAYMLFYRRLVTTDPPGAVGMRSDTAINVISHNITRIQEIQDRTGFAFLEEFHDFFLARLYLLRNVGAGAVDYREDLKLSTDIPVLDTQYEGYRPAVCPTCSRIQSQAAAVVRWLWWFDSGVTCEGCML